MTNKLSYKNRSQVNVCECVISFGEKFQTFYPGFKSKEKYFTTDVVLHR